MEQAVDENLSDNNLLAAQLSKNAFKENTPLPKVELIGDKNGLYLI